MDEEVFAFGSFRLIPAQRTLSEDGKPLRLGSRAFDILVALVGSAGEMISKEELITRAWCDTVVEEAALRVHVAVLRKALGDGAMAAPARVTSPSEASMRVTVSQAVRLGQVAHLIWRCRPDDQIFVRG